MACGRGGKRGHVPLPAADEAEPEYVHEDKATALGAAVVEGSMESGEQSFGGLYFGNYLLRVRCDELWGAYSHSAHSEAVMRK